MSTVLLNKEYGVYDAEKNGVIPCDKLFVEIYMGATKQRVPLSKLYVKTKRKDKEGFYIVRPVKSLDDFITNLSKKNVYNSKTASQLITYGIRESDLKVEYKVVDIPKTYDSTSINVGSTVVPYGLKRNLTVKEDPFKKSYDGSYILVEINGKQEFVKKENIYYYDEENVKHEFKNLNLKTIGKTKHTFYTTEGDEISKIYFEKQFTFTKINAQEYLDLETLEKSSYVEKIDDSGKSTYENNKVKLQRNVSEHRFVKKTVVSETKLGETEEASFVSVRNFEYNENGQYVLVKINSSSKMVKANDIVDENNNPLLLTDDGKVDLIRYIGKKLKVTIDEKEYNIDPITLEQASLRYETLKTYKDTDAEYGDNTYLRLKGGEYVREKDVVQPIAYKLAKGDNFDKYLYEVINADGTKSYVVLDKNYFKEHGDKTEYKLENAIKVARCSASNNDCIIYQTTSKNQEIEKCKIVNDFEVKKAKKHAIETKEAVASEIENSYINGAYLIQDCYKDDKLVELEENGRRYEYSDTIEYKDYANNLFQYQTLRTKNFEIRNGKVEGGAEYDVKKGISKAFDKWKKFTFHGFAFAMLAGLFIPVVGPYVAAAYTVGVVGSVPGIPLVNGVVGLIKNKGLKKQYKDKTQYNNSIEISNINKEIEHMLTRMEDNEYYPLTKEGMDDAYESIMHRILSLSDTVTENGFVVNNGVAEINDENVNKANQFISKYKTDQAQLKLLESKKNQAETYYKAMLAEYTKAKATHLDGWKGLDALLSRLNEAKAELDAITEEYNIKENEISNSEAHTVDMPDTYAENALMQPLIKKAQNTKIFMCVKYFAEDDQVKSILNTCSAKEKEMLNSLVCKKGDILLKGHMISTSEGIIKSSTGLTEEEKITWLSLQSKLEKLSKIEFKQKPKVEEDNHEEEVADDVEAEEVVEDVVTEEAEVEENVEPTTYVDDKLKKLNDDLGVTKVNKNGTLTKNKENFNLLLSKMTRLLDLTYKKKLDPKEISEYEELKYFINSNYKYINSIIKKQGGLKSNPAYIQDAYDEFITTRNQLMTALTQKGVIVNPDGTFLTAEDIKREAESGNLSV